MTHLLTLDRCLDVRGKAADSAVAAILETFDSLAPGERFVLVAGDLGAPTLRRLQAERPGKFEWSPLAYGPPAWRTEIARRETTTGASRRVAEALAWDHERLDTLEEAAFAKRSGGDLQAAFDLYTEFVLGLRRHIGFEERILFPAFEAVAGLPAGLGPTAVMRAEHREIERLLEEIAGSIGDAASEVDVPRAQLQRVIAAHDFKEEQVLYPGIDRWLGPEGADRIVGEIQRYVD